MQVTDIMTKNPACCTPDTNLQEVAMLMVEHDCGETPVVKDKKSMKLIGVITDRDITIRTVAEGKNPLEMTASFPAVMWYWLFFGLLQVTAGYTSTFVAQYGMQGYIY